MLAVISSLTISLGLFCLLVAAVAWWVLRTSSASLAIKMVVPVAMLVLVCASYRTLPDAFGYPVDVAFSALPQQAELVAFLPHDDEKFVDLWLVPEGSNDPRAYSVELTPQLKETLRRAREEKAQGRRAMLAKGGKKAQGKGHPAYIGIDGGEAPYVLLPGAFSLPAKGDAK